jgi:hypothetical protein
MEAAYLRTHVVTSQKVMNEKEGRIRDFAKSMHKRRVKHEK